MKFKLVILISLLAVTSCRQQEESFEGLKEINGTQIFVKSTGHGSPILAIHGGPGLSHDYLLPHLAPLSESNHLIMYDQRGGGRSSVEIDTSTMSLTQFADDVEALRNEMGVDKMYLLAHSWGAYVACEYAMTYPDNILGIILVHPIPFSSEFDDKIRQKQANAMDSLFLERRKAIIDSEAFKNNQTEAYDELFKLSFSLTFENKYDVRLLNLNLNENFQKSQQLLRSFKPLSRDYLQELPSLSIPSLVINGTRDLIVLEADSALAEALDADLYVMETGHFSFVEKNEDFMKTINSFIESTSTK